jgi:hypothetical protein
VNQSSQRLSSIVTIRVGPAISFVNPLKKQLDIRKATTGQAPAIAVFAQMSAMNREKTA